MCSLEVVDIVCVIGGDNDLLIAMLGRWWRGMMVVAGKDLGESIPCQRCRQRWMVVPRMCI